MVRRAAIVAAVLAVVPAAGATARSADGGTLTVMTRNVYLGANLSPLVAATTPEEASLAAAAILAQLQANDFGRRAGALAAEIAAARPDVVGLQEATLYRTDRPADGPLTPAGTVVQDNLRMLLRALRARGRHYRVAGTFRGADVELPVGLPPALDVRSTDRISLLVRRGVRVRRTVTGAYGAALTFPIAGTAVRLRRGWIRTTLRVRGARIVVFNTHLESSEAQVRASQGQELLARVAAANGPVVVLGDLNSGPGTDTTVYDAMRAGGLGDAWARVHGSAPGLTCCFAADLRTTAQPLASRVDLVLYGNGVRATRAEIVGEALHDRVGGLWPSDHAGVVARLRLSVSSP